jgi:hypothetical protein
MLGAHNLEGDLFDPCPPPLIGPYGGPPIYFGESENCNNDGVFRFDEEQNHNHHSSSYYDDQLVWNVSDEIIDLYPFSKCEVKTGTAGSGEVQCDPGKFALLGGGECTDGFIDESVPDMDPAYMTRNERVTKWKVSCQKYTASLSFSGTPPVATGVSLSKTSDSVSRVWALCCSEQ